MMLCAGLAESVLLWSWHGLPLHNADCFIALLPFYLLTYGQ